jgi:uncharacterized protein YqgC (DUF456 family)
VQPLVIEAALDANLILLLVLAAVLVVAGIAGTVVPALPGPALVFAGLLLAAWAEGFVHVGAGVILALAVLTVLTYVVDFAATALGAKRLGASRRAVAGAALGTFVGIFFGLPGVVIGPFAGAVIAELSARRNLEQAGRAGLGAWLGVVLGTAVKLALVFTMLGVFLAARLL